MFIAFNNLEKGTESGVEVAPFQVTFVSNKFCGLCVSVCDGGKPLKKKDGK